VFIPRFMGSFNVRGTCIVTMEERAGDTKAIWNLVIGAFLGFGVWDLELSPGGFMEIG
jgi:hypothetical protein